jgi:class 3 adenylate cyclase
MAEARVERRLAAILAADVCGYSRLMGIDEEGTLAALKAYRREIIDPKIAEHRGRIVKTTGDGVLVEFASTVDAVRCAIDIQRAMPACSADMPPEKKIEFRIGIDVGDIIVDGEDIFGDGVNVAARLAGSLLRTQTSTCKAPRPRSNRTAARSSARKASRSGPTSVSTERPLMAQASCLRQSATRWFQLSEVSDSEAIRRSAGCCYRRSTWIRRQTGAG